MTAEPTKTDVVPQNSIVRSNSGVHDPTGGVPLGPPFKPTDLGSLGPYRVVRAVGRGGMGMVFLGVDPKLRRKIALKVMLPKYLARPTARERFLREARALAAVRNDHVVNIYQVDEARGVPYLALEYLQGCTLEDYLRDGQPLSLVQLLHVAREVAIGLAASHEHNVIHRDIKPENIWLEAPNGRVKLIDFGLARLPTHPTQSSLDGSVIGTPAYMSPEQARGLEIDARSDLFSLGSVLYRLLAGRPPFSGDTPYFQVVALTGQPHTPLSKINPDLPDNLIALVDALLQKDPAKRPATARELAKELKRIEAQVRHPDQMQNSDGAMSKPLSPTAIPVVNTAASAWAGLDTETSTATPSNGSRIAPPPRPKPFWLWAYFVGTLGLAILVALLILRFG